MLDSDPFERVDSRGRGRTRRRRIRSDLLLLASLAVLVLVLVLAAPTTASAASYAKLTEFGTGTPSLQRFGVAVDPSGDVFVGNWKGCGSASCLVNKFEGGGAYPQLSTFGASATAERGASGVAVNPNDGRVYVVDSRGEEIQVWSNTAGPSSVPLSSFSVAGSKGGIETLFESLGLPIGVLTQLGSDSAGDIYFPNPGQHSVQVFSPAGELKRTITGEAPVGAFSEPRGAAVDSEGNVYVADNTGSLTGSGKARVVRVDASTGAQTELHPHSAGAKSAAVAVDTSTDLVYVGVHGPNPGCGSAQCFHVVVYDSSGTEVEAFGAGQITAAPSPGLGLNDQLAVDPISHDVYITQYERGPAIAVFRQLALPTATTGPASEVTASTARLNGEVNPNGLEAFCRFEWGTTTAYGKVAPCEPEFAGEGINPKQVHAAIGGLVGNTTYHFRLVVEAAGGAKVEGEDEAFTTPQVAPTVGDVRAADVSRDDVTFEAAVNPQNLATTYWFNYSRQALTGPECVPSGPYASAPATPESLGSGSSPQQVSLELSGTSVVLYNGMESRALAPNTTYRFQVVAENSKGRTCVESLFTTLPPPPQAETAEADGVAATTATLNGTVTPGSFGPNSNTTYRFQWGESEAYGQQTPLGDAGMGMSPVEVSAALEGLRPNTTYHYRLTASNANDDPAADPALAPQVANGADRTFATLPLPPIAGAPSGETPTGLTLNGSVDPSGSPLSCRFDYGPSAGYGSSVPCAESEAEIGAGEGHVPVHAELAGLTPGATYHYRLVASGAGGSATSADRTFTLDAPPPLATTGAASGIGPSIATLTGSLDPQGAPASYRFQYGTTAAYGSATPVTPGAGPVSAPLAGLEPSTTYHYRLVAIGPGGVAYGSDGTFSTAPAPAPSTSPQKPPVDCSAPARRAQRFARRAKRLRQRAERTRDRRRAALLRRQARSLSKAARKQSERAKRCRRADREETR